MPELYFKGKEFVYNHHLTVPFRPLEPVPEKSIGADTGNLIIHGDNLHALKALLPRYAGKVDCIFIDPPYNTGNENWCYNDNVNSPIMREWLSSNPVNKEDMLRHDKWLCMMWPRLNLLKELLHDDGVLFVTIDDNEQHRLRGLLDEILGEDCFVASICWQKRTSPESRKRLGAAHDSIHVYSRRPGNAKLAKLGFSDDQVEEFANPDNDPRGEWTSTDLTAQNIDPSKRKDQQYSITLPGGRVVVPPPGRCWSMLEPEYLKRKEEGRIWFGVDGDARPRIKTYLSESEGVSSWTWWPNDEVGHNQEAKKEINQILGHENPFDYPKPVRLISRILELSTTSNSLILDSFAGSGTTAHAVLSLNAKDGGNRNFILVECEDYADTLTAERVRRVVKGYKYKGTVKEELLSQKVSFATLKGVPKLLREIEHIEQVNASRFDKISKNIKDDTLLIVGEKKITKRTEGLGGGFTYYELGHPLDLDKLLTGEQLPDYANLGAWLFHTATGDPLALGKVRADDWYLGESTTYHVWLLYRPDLEWLKSREAALTLTLAEKIAATAKDKRHLVFAPARFVASKHLLPLGVEHAPLPFALYRFEKD